MAKTRHRAEGEFGPADLHTAQTWQRAAGEPALLGKFCRY